MQNGPFEKNVVIITLNVAAGKSGALFNLFLDILYIILHTRG